MLAHLIGIRVEQRVARKCLRHVPHTQIAVRIVEERRRVIGESIQHEYFTCCPSDMFGSEEKHRGDRRTEKAAPSTFVLPAAIGESATRRVGVVCRISG